MVRKRSKAIKWNDVLIPVAAIAKQGINLTPEEALSLIEFREQMKRVDVRKEFEHMNYTEAEIMRATIDLVVHAIENHNAQMAAHKDKT